ncbi:MAG: arginine--tRNA ligase [Planctomycetota bacterium]|nr:arginine--tRNA ligase [Planctomycetota bacterium]
MNILSELKSRFHAALAPLTDNAAELVELIRPSQDPKFGDYQANCAMPLGKSLSRPPREIADEIVSRLKIDDICEPPEIAGPGFINLRLRTDWLTAILDQAASDERLGIAKVASPRTYIVDFSGPNVAKPMHVGHIRSTVIGDALYRTLKFLGHTAIGDNHLGDWGTQFGMILYGYKHFLDKAVLQQNPVNELARLYRLVRKLVDYQQGKKELPTLETRLAAQQQALAAHLELNRTADPKEAKKAEKATRQLERTVQSAREAIDELLEKLSAVEKDPQLFQLAQQHADIAAATLQETAKLHSGDAENLRLWKEFLPACSADIDRIYQRLDVSFDETLGESFYHDRLAPTVQDLEAKGLAKVSQGATVVFLPGQEIPMLIRKQDGAFLYATTDLATIQYRMQHWKPDAILYVVDHRQSLHFEQLFAVARLWGYKDVELQHVSFGTVLGDDGRPFKTRSGDTVGLWGLLDEAVERALKIVSENDDGKPGGAELDTAERQQVAEAIGIGAIKYADLSQNRSSDYTFSYDKMLAMQGNTAAYMQYAHARVRSIFARGEKQLGELESAAKGILLENPAERALAIAVLRFSEALETMITDYRPNHLTNYLYELSNAFSTFYEKCPVLKAETAELQRSRLALCDITARTLALGLNLLGIKVVERM